jgi:uncharacterized membrane protein
VNRVKGMYRNRLQQDMERWVAQGLVERPAADAMLAEYDARPSGAFSVGRVLMVLSALLIAAAIAMLIASNWDALPRGVRLVSMLALVTAFYMGAAAFFIRGADYLGGALLILAVLCFGGTVSLTAQMYHISGDSQTFLMTWFLFAMLAAVLFRSGGPTVIAGFLSWAYFSNLMFDDYSAWNSFQGLMPLAMAAAIIALVYYTGPARARHFSYLLILAWLFWFYSEHENDALAIVYTLAGTAAFLTAVLPKSPLRSANAAAGGIPATYAFLLMIAGLAFLHDRFDGTAGRISVAVAVIVATVVALMLNGRDNGIVRYLAYLIFAAELIYLCNETIGSLIGTSGFFLLSGVFVALAAFAVIRLEKRLAPKPKAVSA